MIAEFYDTIINNVNLVDVFVILIFFTVLFNIISSFS